MRAARLIAALAAFACIAAPASADTLESLFGNTLTVSYPSGNIERFYFDADGGFTMVMQGAEIPARWAREGEAVCILMQGAPPQCSEFPAGKAVGDSWEAEGPNGAVRYEISAGR